MEKRDMIVGARESTVGALLAPCWREVCWHDRWREVCWRAETIGARPDGGPRLTMEGKEKQK